jgi:hypothetical protein
MIEREMDILSKQGLLPPMPPLLKEAKGEYKHVYDSPIDRIMSAEANSGTMRTFQALGELSQLLQDPSVLDVINVDQAAMDMARNNRVPETSIRTPKELQAIKQKRAQMQQQQQQIQAAPAMAGVMKAMKQ